MRFTPEAGSNRLMRYEIGLAFPDAEDIWKGEKELDLDRGEPDKQAPGVMIVDHCVWGPTARSPQCMEVNGPKF